MKTINSLSKVERQKIFTLFTKNSKLKFNEIEKAIKIRSNMISYYLDQMKKEGILQKKGDYYSLTNDAERYIPTLTHLLENEVSPLPVVLIALTNKNKILLIKRNKRPYQNYWSMIGGKIKLKESFEEASIRHIFEKTGINAKFKQIKSVFHEHVTKDNQIKHSFILFFIQMTTTEEKFKESEHGKLKWFEIDKLKQKEIIPSDFWLIKNKLNSRIKINCASMEENEEKLTKFKLK
jgi:ADP-ribose pyrophosphatase YjhB (NUDIX family)